MLTTDFDLIFGIVKEKEETLLDEVIRSMIRKKRGVKMEDIENYLKIFADVGVIDVLYSTSPFGKDKVRFLNPRLERPFMVEMDEREREEVLDEYAITLEDAEAKVEIFNARGDFNRTYMLRPLEIGEGTLWLLEYVSRQVPGLLEGAGEEEESVSLRRSNAVRKQLSMRVREIIKRLMPKENETKRNILSNVLIHELIGFGTVDFMIEDENLEEIVFQGTGNPVTVYHRKYAWMKTNVWIGKEEYIFNIAERIGRNIGRAITVLNPVLDAYMSSGERVSAILSPISAGGNTVTIRKFRKNPWTIVHLLSPEHKTLNKDIAALLWLGVQYELNILIAGGTASGKTSLLNALCQFLPVNQHVITIEEIEELTLPKYFKWNWIHLVERKPISGRGEVTLLELLVASLRMRPDRIIVGEVRRPKEAEVLFEAMHTGHSAYGTVHADNAYQVYRRLVDPPFSIPALDLEALHLLVVQRRDRVTGGRRTHEVAEVEIPETFKEREFSMSILYRWGGTKDKILPVNKPKRIFDELYFYTGMDMKEINRDLSEKKKILDWMLKNNINYVDGVGKVVSEYYKDPDRVLDVVEKNGSPDKLLHEDIEKMDRDRAEKLKERLKGLKEQKKMLEDLANEKKAIEP